VEVTSGRSAAVALRGRSAAVLAIPTTGSLIAHLSDTAFIAQSRVLPTTSLDLWGCGVKAATELT
jgi:hypothetical protein